MNSTTLDEAVDSMIVTPDAEKDQEENLNEAPEQVEAVSDGEAEEMEAVDEGSDDAEELSSEDDSEIDYEETEADDTEPDQERMIEVTVDGEKQYWTEAELQRDAAGQKAINKRFQEIAQVRKQFEQKEAEIAKREAQALGLANQIQNGSLVAPTPPSSELFESDPIGYMEQKMKYDEAKTAYDQSMYQVQTLQQQQQQAQAQAHQSYLQEQAEVLRKRIPEIADPVKGEALKQSLVQTGVAYGFTEDEMSMVTDARYIEALNDARKYRELKSKRKATQAKGEKARPVVKAGVKKRKSTGVQAEQQKAQQRLMKTGSIDDALSLMLNND